MSRPFPESIGKWPLSAFFFYPLTKGAMVAFECGWWLEAHVLTIGPLAFIVCWRKRRPDTPGEATPRAEPPR